MKCPKCNKEIEIIWRYNSKLLPNGDRQEEIVGRCDDCDYDGHWVIDTEKMVMKKNIV